MVEVIPMLGCGVGAMMAASLAMSAGATAMTYMGQKKAAKEQKAYQDHLAKMQGEAAQRKVSAAVAQEIQNREATARNRFTVSQEAAKASADMRLSAIEGGVTGLSIDHLYSEIQSQESAYIFALGEEDRLRTRELGRASKNIMLGAEQQMYATQRPVQEPSALAAMLSFGADAASTGASYYKYQNTLPKSSNSSNLSKTFGGRNSSIADL